MVNNRAITYAELDKTYQWQFGANPEQPTNDDLVMTQKLELLRSLIDNVIMVQRAEKLGLMAVDADVDAKINEMKAPYTKEEFQRQLDQRKMTPDDLKAQIRRELTIERLFNKEITSHITITDADVADGLQLQQGQLQFHRAAGAHGADPGDARRRSRRAIPTSAICRTTRRRTKSRPRRRSR